MTIGDTTVGLHCPVEICIPARHDMGAVVVSVRARRLRKELRPLVWVTLEEVALDAVFENGRLVARTSARLIADRLGVDPGTAAGALRTLRRRGLVAFERERAVPLAALDCRSMSSATSLVLRCFHVRIAHVWRRHGRKNQIRSLPNWRHHRRKSHACQSPAWWRGPSRSCQPPRASPPRRRPSCKSPGQGTLDLDAGIA